MIKFQSRIKTKNLIIILTVLFAYHAIGSHVMLLFYFLSLILVSIYIFIYRKGKLKLPQQFILLIVFYIPFLLYGIVKNESPHIDIKFHLFIIYFYLLIKAIGSEVDFASTFLKSLFVIALFTFCYYLVFFSLDLPKSLNIYDRGTDAAGYGYRIEGPSLIVFSLIPIFYMLRRYPWDIYLSLTFFIGLFSSVLNGSLQYLVIFVITYSLFLIKKQKYLIIFPVMLIILFKISEFIIKPFTSDAYQEKLSYIENPLEYPTVKHRLETLEIMLNKTTSSTSEIIFGSGVGVRSTYFEENEDSPSLSRERTFLEIDNGFFYVYHRTGLFGLSIFLFFIISVLFKRKTNINSRLAPFSILVITNLLSIHFFTNAFFILLLMLSYLEIKKD